MPLNDPVVPDTVPPTILPLILVALKAPVEELNVRLALLLACRLPVAAVTNVGKQVVSDA